MKKLLILIVVAGFVLRTYKIEQLFMYSHDQDLASWIVSDIVENRHMRLIGQETSVHGVFIGGLYYYLLVPFYLAFGMSPLSGLVMVTALSLATMVSVYWVFGRIFDGNVALTATLIYAVSFSVVFIDREVVPTTLVLFWTIWFLYSLYLVRSEKRSAGMALSGFLAGIVWHINLALIILSPLILMAYLGGRKKKEVVPLAWSVAGFGLGMLPFAAFEARHGFVQTRSVLSSLTAKEEIATSHWEKFDRVMQLVIKNFNSLWGSNLIALDPKILFFAGTTLLVALSLRRLMRSGWADIAAYWLAIYLAFFSFNSINPSEYYFNGMIIMWIVLASLALTRLKELVNPAFYIVMGLFLTANVYRFWSMDINRSGYLERTALVGEIESDAESHGYGCVAVSYITEPGYELGYRYLFKREQLHVNRPDSGSPVYTIVYPHSLVDRIDKSFGALGLIYPDYERYEANVVAESCRGENSNLTDPLFGYTQ
jgi:hypothetical protein